MKQPSEKFRPALVVRIVGAISALLAGATIAVATIYFFALAFPTNKKLILIEFFIAAILGCGAAVAAYRVGTRVR